MKLSRVRFLQSAPRRAIPLWSGAVLERRACESMRFDSSTLRLAGVMSTVSMSPFQGDREGSNPFTCSNSRTVSSAAEHLVYTEMVGGSNPSQSTSLWERW